MVAINNNYKLHIKERYGIIESVNYKRGGRNMSEEQIVSVKDDEYCI